MVARSERATIPDLTIKKDISQLPSPYLAERKGELSFSERQNGWLLMELVKKKKIDKYVLHVAIIFSM